MSLTSKDIVPLTRARAKLTELVDEVHRGLDDVDQGKTLRLAKLKSKHGR